MSELTPASIKKFKVAELRSELSKLGLDTKGTKPILVERLLEATSAKNEENNDVEAKASTEGEQTETDSKEESSQESQDESASSTKVDEPVESVEPSEVANDAKVEDEKVVEETPVSEAVSSEKMETNEESAAAPEAGVVTAEEEPAKKAEDAVSEPAKVEDKAVEKDEPMDQTPAETTPSKDPSKSRDAPKEQHGDDLDVSVDISKVEEEPEVEIDDSLVVLDKYNCDLYLKVSPEALSCSTLKEEAVLYLSGGARATWGVATGKVCYEVKITEIQEVDLPDSEEPKQFVRVGWSVDTANFQLGEDNLSYGYDSTGKKCTNSEFSDFAETFGKDDVITCYLDLDSEVKKVSFSKNGEEAAEAFDLPEEVIGKALFPHVLIKNAECTLNFGSQEEPWSTAKEGFTFIQNSSEDSKVHGTRGPATKQDCEVLMMVGLPASGKSTHVKNHVSENPDKKYNILGTSTVLDRMKLLGVARKQELGGYNKYMDKAAKCLHRLFEIAPSKKRNYILDQTNVYMSAQNKKMRPFEGFKRKALVCIPTHDVLKNRTEDRKKEGIELPFNAVCDMKRSFTIPKVGEMFDEVIYVDQDEEASKKIVAEYIKDGNYQRRRTFSGSGEPEHKRPRHHERHRYGGHGGGGGGGGGGWYGGPPRDYRHDNRRGGGYRGSPQNRRGGSPGYGRGGRGGYRDNYRGGRGGYQGGGYQDRRSYGGGGNKGYGGGGRNYGGGGGSYGSGGYGGSYSNQQSHKQHYNYGQQQQTPQQPAQQQYSQQQGNYGNYNQYYQNYQQYGQQTQQTGQQAANQTYQQQYPAYYQQQGTYQQGGYSGGYGY